MLPKLFGQHRLQQAFPAIGGIALLRRPIDLRHALVFDDPRRFQRFGERLPVAALVEIDVGEIEMRRRIVRGAFSEIPSVACRIPPLDRRDTG
jgi:hypothetical protein